MVLYMLKCIVTKYGNTSEIFVRLNDCQWNGKLATVCQFKNKFIKIISKISCISVSTVLSIDLSIHTLLGLVRLLLPVTYICLKLVPIFYVPIYDKEI